MNNQFSTRQKRLLVLYFLIIITISFVGGFEVEHSILIPPNQELRPLTIMQYYSSPELLIKALHDKQIDCNNLPLEIKKMINTLEKGTCSLSESYQ